MGGLRFAFALLALIGSFAAQSRAAEQALSQPGQPIITVLYDCDSVFDPKFASPVIVPDGRQTVISVTGRGIVYFTITTEFHTPDGEPETKTMHFVLGAYDANGGKVRVQGRFDEDNTEAALIKLDRGWIWMSSDAPENWRGTARAESSASFDQAAEPRPFGMDSDPAVSWSIYTLLRTRYTWAGAVGTEFIYRVERSSGGDETVVLYNLDEHSTAHHSYRQAGKFGKHDLGDGQYSRSTKRGDVTPGKPIADRAPDKAFADYVQCRVSKIVRHPDTAECGKHHKECGG